MQTRRDMLRFGLAAGMSGLSTTFAIHAADSTSFPIVDTHTHFYDPSRPQGVPWPGKDDAALYRTVLPADYRKLGDPLGVTGTVIVEASPWVDDNHWLLDLSQNDPFVLGIVGNLAPGSPEFAKHFVRFVRNKLFLGIRVNSGPLADGLKSPAFLDDIKRLALAGLEIDINGGPELLPLIDQLAAKFPDLRIVINHLANVRIDGKTPPKEWLAGMEVAAKHPLVYCKASAMVEGAAQPGKKSPTDAEFYQLVLDHAWKTFGEDRLIYGSDWPVSERVASLADVQRLMMDYLADQPQIVREKFFAANAKQAYRWVDR